MSLWGNLDAANNAPKQGDTSGYGGNSGSVTANTQKYYANTQIDAFINDATVGVFGVDTTEQILTRTNDSSHRSAHAGWVIKKSGTGPVLSVTANSGAVGANATLRLTGGGVSNTPATVLVSCNAAGFITAVTVTSGGQYVTTPSANTMSNAAFTIVMGGRANRIQTETVVAMGSMTGDGSDDTFYPDA
jgi:hypothetical protein